MADNKMDGINFWQLNKKLILVLFTIPLIFCFILIHTSSKVNYGSIFYVFLFLILSSAIYILFIMPARNGFKVIKRLAEDISDQSIILLFESEYTVDLQNENSWFLFTVPFISATISELPVKIYYHPAGRNSSSYLSLDFGPLMKENSKRIYQEFLSYKMGWKKRLKKDIKPEILEFVSDIKSKGFSSGVGRKVSTTHFDAYE